MSNRSSRGRNYNDKQPLRFANSASPVGVGRYGEEKKSYKKRHNRLNTVACHAANAQV